LPGLAEALLFVFAPVKRLAQFLVGGLSSNKIKKIYYVPSGTWCLTPKRQFSGTD